ncbi:MAG: AIR synthase related protein, partial [Bacteroidota bacterium]
MSNQDNSRYNQRGVSYSKSEVHEAIKGLDKGLYPLAFCKILPDYIANDPNFCNIMHADTAGTKTSLAYLYWKETGDLSVWEGIVQDALVMNLDDMACVGAINNIIISSTIGRNKNLIPGDVLKVLIQGCTKFLEKMKAQGIQMHLSGGETADVGDIVRTIDVGYTTFSRLAKSDLIVNNIQDGDVIIGLASYGQASYEEVYNSGIGSNGLTSARHDTLSKYYMDHYPESFDPNTSGDVIFTGSRKLTDSYNHQGKEYEVGKLLLSPTRTYIPVLAEILKKSKSEINGIIHCTGGAQTKVLKFIENKKVIKDNLLPLPPVFKLIQEESNTAWEEMYKVFN